MGELRMPSLGASMDEGTLIAWRKRPGETVARGEVIAEIETDKGAIEMECFESGVVTRLLLSPGERVPVGTPIAIIGEEGAPADAAPSAPAPAPAPPPAPPAAPPAASSRVRASPMARRRARELGLALEALQGSGPGGAITAQDVERATQAPAPAPSPTPSPAGAMRRAIAAVVTQAKRDIPHFYARHTLDLGPALAWLDEANRTRPVADRLLTGVVLLKAVATALGRVPELSATPLPGVHLSLVIFLRGGGLVAPTLRDVDRRPLDDLMRGFKDLVDRARTGRLRGSELTGGSLGVTSLGELGAEEVFPVIFPPQLAMVGLGAVIERPWCVDGAVVPRPLVRATLAADHRAVDGRAASRFLRALEAAVKEPDNR